MHKVVFRDEANNELIAIYDYIAGESSPEIAIGYIRRMRMACTALAHFPERGRKRDDLLKGLRTIGFERRATIIYRVLKTRVEIVSIAYGGRNFEARLRKGK